MKLNSKNIFASVSAGYSSVMMAVKLKEWYPDHNIIYAMANTSKEKKESLEFMQKCADHFGFDLVWIESIINQEKGKGSDYRTVKYTELKTEGQIFADGIKKYGIPSRVNKWCNRELKLIPMTKFCNDIFNGEEYSVAIGIRSDEIDRVSSKYKENNIFYPLIEHRIDSKERNRFWKDQPVQIKIKAYQGNCDFCFEKSLRKLMTIHNENKTIIEWWCEQFNEHGKRKIEGKNQYNEMIDTYGYVNFLRENITFEELVELSRQPFSKATNEYIYESDLFDQEDDCGVNCQVW